jgi:rubrerythrin
MRVNRKEFQKKVLALLDEWLAAEDDTIAMTSRIHKATRNEAIRLYMEIVRMDSMKHKKIQEFLKETMTQRAASLSFDEIGAISGMVNDHLVLEQKTVDLGHEILPKVALPIEKQLFEYLLADEQLHVQLLRSLSQFKGAAETNT